MSRTALLFLLLTAIVGAFGVWVGTQYGVYSSHERTGLHDLLHTKLDLSSDQIRRIEEMEERFAVTRKTREAEMRAANQELADAIAIDHSYGPKAQQAISRFHAAEAQLQEETVKHVLGMRTVLTQKQIGKFDHAVREALTSD